MPNDSHDWEPIAWYDKITHSVRTETYHRRNLLSALMIELGVSIEKEKTESYENGYAVGHAKGLLEGLDVHKSKSANLEKSEKP